ncbi:MAG: hypothetical protein QXE10_05140 [Desulfurococcaceae archaeon]
MRAIPIGREELEAYLKLRKHGEPVSIRGFQRLMGYNSPGKAERVEKTSSGYIVGRDLPPELSSYIIVKGYVFPRSLVYATYSSVVVTTYVLLARPPEPLILLLLLIIAPYWIGVVREFNTLKKLRKGLMQ